MDIVSYLLQVTNMLAALFGAAVVILVQKFLPVKGAAPATSPDPGWLTIVNRLLPFLAMIAAAAMTLALEGISSLALCRGVVSGLLSEQVIRIWYKSVVGV